MVQMQFMWPQLLLYPLDAEYVRCVTQVTCRKGIATQDPQLRRRLDYVEGGKRVARYIKAMTEEAVMLTQQAGNTDVLKLRKRRLKSTYSGIFSAYRSKDGRFRISYNI